MSETVTTADGIAALLRADGRSRQEGIKAAVVEAAQLGAEIVANKCPRMWRGHLRQSIIADTTPQGSEVRVDAPYAGIIEAGARPHWTPIGPLLEWATDHAKDGNGWALAKYVQKKIAERGSAPTWWVKGCLPQMERVLAACIKKAMER
jgi:hypothetical protein